jgi:hypothetical protein
LRRKVGFGGDSILDQNKEKFDSSSLLQQR